MHTLLSEIMASHEPTDTGIEHILRAVRVHMGMEVAFVSEFVDGHRVFRHVDSAHEDCPVLVSQSDLLEESYCQRVVDGRLPGLLHDAGSNVEALSLPVTRLLPIGAHVSVPIRFDDGSLYGTFCCFSREGDATLNDRDLEIMSAFAEIAAKQLQKTRDDRRKLHDKNARISGILDGSRFRPVYQSIVDLRQGLPVGLECLTRFPDTPFASPADVFAEAAELGLGVRMEMAAIKAGLLPLDRIPKDQFLSLNASCETVTSVEFGGLLQRLPTERIVLEITEHEDIPSYQKLLSVLAPLRAGGLRLAIDDAGAGYASMKHILHLRPDLIKLDVSLIRDIHIDENRRALASALVGFAKATASEILAEGIETSSELETVRALGISLAQGYLFSPPVSIDQIGFGHAAFTAGASQA